MPFPSRYRARGSLSPSGATGFGTTEEAVPFSPAFLRKFYRGFAMNRKQRRMAAKLGTRAAASVGRNATISPSGQIADLLARGQRHHHAGQFAEAENYCRKLLAIDPNHFDGLHLLGVIAQQVGRSDLAASYIGKAIALHDQNPALHDPRNSSREQSRHPPERSGSGAQQFMHRIEGLGRPSWSIESHPMQPAH